jgi:hypothetical protein
MEPPTKLELPYPSICHNKIQKKKKYKKLSWPNTDGGKDFFEVEPDFFGSSFSSSFSADNSTFLPSPSPPPPP